MSLERRHAATLQKCVLSAGHDQDWLFRQCQRIADSLGRGEIALAQIYGLRIAIGELDDWQLRRIAFTNSAKTGFNPDEPRIPKGDPHGGEWTTADGETPASAPVAIDSLASEADDGQLSATTPSRDASPDEPPAPDPYASMEMSPATLPPGTGDSSTQEDQGGSPDSDPQAGNPPGTPTAPEDENSAPKQSGEDAQPPIQWTINIPDEQPDTARQVNALLRSIAVWLAAAMLVLEAADPEVEAAIVAIEAASWLAAYAPKIWSYLDSPKPLEELQNAVGSSWPGYETHHIVETQRGSENPQSNAKLYPDRIDSRENRVLIPYWKHVEISAWYSRRAEEWGNLTLRDYLRGKSWDEQYRMGLEALRRYGVLK